LPYPSAAGNHEVVEILWFSVMVDVPAPRFDRAMEYWSAVTGWRRGRPIGDHDEYVPLEPPEGDTYLWFQRIGSDTAGCHLDLHVYDLDAAAAEAQAKGARLDTAVDGLRVLATPAGQPFCFVEEDAGRHRQAPEPPKFDSGRHLVDQLSFDLPAAEFDRDADFWAALTGWRRRGREEEFDRIAVPEWLPVQFLLQRLDEDDSDGVHAHLDLSADDRDADVERHRQLGAEVVRRTEHWTTLRDPAGVVYCVTARATGRRFT